MTIELEHSKEESKTDLESIRTKLYADSTTYLGVKDSMVASCTAAPPAPEPEVKFSGKEAYPGYQVIYRQMFNEVAKNYYDKNALKDFAKLESAFDDKLAKPSDLDLALKLMAQSLEDRYTWYLSAAEVKKGAEEAQQLKQSGIGIHKYGNGFKIDSIAFGSAAHNTELQEGDRVRCIDNIAIDSLTENQAQRLLQGRDGKSVSVLAQSKSDGTEYSVTLPLKEIQPPSVESRLIADDIIYVRFPTFEERGRVTNYANLAAFSDHFSAQLKSAGGKAKGLVLDLRNNGGGDTEEAILFASLFLKDGQTVSRFLPQKGVEERQVAGPDQFVFNGTQLTKELREDLQKIPMVILSNGSSASSSELTIGALKDNKRATIVGEQTFGKGVGFKVMLGRLGGNLSITNLKYLTPNGYDLNGKGIAPDINVKANPKTPEDEQLERALKELRK